MNASNRVPAGWYPDPAGERRWRVWNGAEWTLVTRPYGDALARDRPSLEAADLATIDSLRRVTRFGVLAYYTGFALLVSILAHWPGHAHPVSPRFASVTLGAALGLGAVGTAAFATLVRALRGRWTLDAVIPVLNTFVAAYWTSRRLGLARTSARLVTDALITVGFVLLCGRQPWVGLALAGVAFSQLARAFALVDRLSGPQPPVID